MGGILLRPALPILIGAAVMLSLSMGLRQSFGLIMQPLTQDIALTVSDSTLALARQNLAWGLLQPVAGALAHGSAFVRSCWRAPHATRWACCCWRARTGSSA